MGSGNGSGALLERRAARAALAQAPGKEKLDLLLSAPDPRRLVQSLPEQELYLTVLDIGPEDAAELVALASPKQFLHFLDAGCWPRRDAPPDPRKVLKWLTLARKGADASEGSLRRYAEKLTAIDAELFSLVLRLELIVHELDEDEPPPDVSGNTWTSPDRRYLVEIKEDGSGYVTLKRLLDDLTAQDPFLVSRTLEAIRWDVPTELEETARRWRDGRLRDLGVPGFEEALGFVARPARKASKSDPNPAPVPGTSTALTAPAAAQVPLLDRAIARLDGEQLAFAEEAIAYAANASLVAWSVPLDDAPEVRRVLGDARALLSLGLELVADGDEAAAAQALGTTPVRQIFQAAMGELYRLQSRARAAAKELQLPQARSATLLEPPHAQLVDALASTPPVVAGLGGPRASRDARAPSSRAEVAQADALLAETEALPALLAALGLSPAALGAAADEAGLTPSALRASDALRALALCDLRGEPFSLRGLPDRGAPLPEGFAARVEALVAKAAAAVGGAAAQRAAAALRARALG